MPRKGERLKKLKPGQLIGSSTANKLIDFFNAFMAAKIVNGSSNDLLIGDLAILFKINGGGSSSGSSSSISMFRFKSYHASYFTCRTWDGTTEGSTDVYICSPFKLLEISGETIDGDAYSYAYATDGSGNRIRTVSLTGSPLFTEKQMIIPRLQVNDLILAIPIPTGYTTQTIPITPTYVDLNVDARAWCGTSGITTAFPAI